MVILKSDSIRTNLEQGFRRWAQANVDEVSYTSSRG